MFIGHFSRTMPPEPRELGKIAHCDARALRAAHRRVPGRHARSRRQPEIIAWLLMTAAAPQQLSRFSRIHSEVFYGKKADNVGHCLALSVRFMAARDSLLLASIYWVGRKSRATLPSPPSDPASAPDRPTAGSVACRVIVLTLRA